MIGIAGQPLIELDKLVDLTSFNASYDAICRALAVTPWGLSSFGKAQFAAGYEQEVNTALPLPPEIAAACVGLNTEATRKLLKLKYGMQVSTHSIYLRQALKYGELGAASANKDTGAYATTFAFLRPFINSLPFSEIGRILFFVTDHFVPTPMHGDIEREFAGVTPHKQEFIWIRPKRLQKSFYVFDEVAEVKHPVQGQACWFNSYDLHAAPASDVLTWSLRIDGKFTEAFRKELGL
jgi:hypothetical protein